MLKARSVREYETTEGEAQSLWGTQFLQVMEDLKNWQTTVVLNWEGAIGVGDFEMMCCSLD